MKIQFVDNSADLQQRFIEPLRKKGWGVVRARSLEDAEKMMGLHGEGLDAVVVGEKFISFGEKHEPPFMVLVSQWGQGEIAAHQAASNPAIAYVSSVDGFQKIQDVLLSRTQAEALPATGTDGFSQEAVSLENVTGMLSRPEPTRNFTRSLTLKAPKVFLGGIDASRAAEVEEISLEEGNQDQLLVDPKELGNPTMVLEKTQVAEALGITEDEPVAESEPAFPAYEELDLSKELGVEFDSTASLVRPSNPAGSDVETLKRYLALREQDVALLAGQFRSSQERIHQLETQFKIEKARSAELQQMLLKSEQKVKNYDQEKQIELEVMEKQMDDLNLQLKERTEKVRTFEAKLRMTHEEVSKVKERVKVDIRRIRVREKELESQLEILKKDSSALLQARDEKIVELKRKLDILEFNMEIVQEQCQKERQAADDLKGRLKDAAQAMKAANGLLEQ